MKTHVEALVHFALAFVLTVGAPGCGSLCTKGALKSLNGASPPPDRNYEVRLETRIARLVKGHLADSYFNKERAAEWMRNLGSKPEPLKALTCCIVNAKNGVEREAGCYRTFMNVTKSMVTDVPDMLVPSDGFKNEKVRLEVDAERFLANARTLGSSLAAMERMVGRPLLFDKELRPGIADGAERAARYVSERNWQRSDARPTTAIVLSGGAANGAFSAGVIWQLLGVLHTCHAAPTDGCPGARIDLIAGTSTGALIGLVVDWAATEGLKTEEQERARKFLLDAYTCSTSSSLYCVNNKWIWKLATGDVKGMVRFDRIRETIMRDIPEHVRTNATERVSVSVDFQSGDIQAKSDQDPEDKSDWNHDVDSVLASSVEPVLAEPIFELSRDGKPLSGTFLDGGVRSGLPLLEAVRRGAERVLIVNNSGIEPDRMGPQKNALQILARTVDLLSGQPRPDELQLGELSALARRWMEYNVCQERVRLTLHEESSRAAFCQRQGLWQATSTGVEEIPPAAEEAGRCQEAEEREPRQTAVPPSASATGYFPQVASTWRTSWVFRPEENVTSAVGYEFDPKVMRGLFLSGVRTFQSRCSEILSLLAIDGSVARAACDVKPGTAAAQAEAAFGSLAACSADVGKMRICK